MKRAIFFFGNTRPVGPWLAFVALWLLAPLGLAPAAFAADAAASLCFTAESDGAAVGMEAIDGTECEDEDEDVAEAERKAPRLELEISSDGQDWQEWKQPRKIALPHKGDRAYVRAKSTNPSFGKIYLHKDGRKEIVVHHFTVTGKVVASGNVMTLLDRTGRLRSLAGLPRAFMGLFFDCQGLTTPPELPATELADECYDLMFKNCAGLTAAPELPATKLAEMCYAWMFIGCERLTAAPKLPAMELTLECYNGMFHGCKGLTIAPELPATVMAQFCYARMFEACTSLTSAPKLPATQLAEGCYYKMFQDCSGLVEAPELPAALADDSHAETFDEMFQGCDKLKHDPTKRK